MSIWFWVADAVVPFIAGFGLSRGCGWLTRRWAAKELADIQAWAVEGAAEAGDRGDS